MLYSTFRDTLARIKQALDELYEHAAPDLMERDLASPELQELLDEAEATERRLETILAALPRVTDLDPDQQNLGLGPVMHPDDLHLVVSIVVPSALTLDSTYPAESYEPVEFFSEKMIVLLGAIQFYFCWKQYTAESRTTVWQGFGRVLPPGSYPDVTLLDSGTPCLARLFRNVSFSDQLAQEAIESYLQQPLGEI